MIHKILNDKPTKIFVGFTAFFALALILSLLVFIGDALREAFDPRA